MFPSKFLQFPSILTHFHAANEKIQNGGRDLAISRGLVWVKREWNFTTIVSHVLTHRFMHISNNYQTIYMKWASFLQHLPIIVLTFLKWKHGQLVYEGVKGYWIWIGKPSGKLRCEFPWWWQLKMSSPRGQKLKLSWNRNRSTGRDGKMVPEPIPPDPPQIPGPRFNIKMSSYQYRKLWR